MARLQRKNHGKGHSYRLDGDRVPGVTTILNSLPKTALIDWAARTTAEYAEDHWDELAALPLSQRRRILEQARWNVSKSAALRGTQIHALAERLAHGLDVDVPDEHVGPVEAVARFLDRHRIQPLGTEVPVVNTAQLYAGTADGLFTVGADPDPVVIDWKTGWVGDESALQLAAYAKCDLWQPDGPDSEAPMPAVSRAYVARVLPDDVVLLPVVEDMDRLFLQFRYLHATWRWLEQAKDEPAIGEAVEPAAVDHERTPA